MRSAWGTGGRRLQVIEARRERREQAADPDRDVAGAAEAVVVADLGGGVRPSDARVGARLPGALERSA
ncbi:hypothetical protein ACE1SV_65880 [Streptomyces sennicomposti]